MPPAHNAAGKGAAAAVVVAAIAMWAAACSVKLPEPESEGAKLYAARCDTCHRLYAPSALKFDMWKMKVEAMQGEMARRGIPPLNAKERDIVLDYLQRHAG